MCPDHSHEIQFTDFIAARTPLNTLQKLEADVAGRHICAVNDIYIHNIDQASALRYQVWIDDELYAEEIAGDAVGLSSVHGSSAYYRSITHSVFRTGIGLAFSNSMELINHMVLHETSKVEIRIVRGPAMVVADNAPERIVLNEGERAILRQSTEIARFYGLKNFMCPRCRFMRHIKQYRQSTMAMPKPLT